MFSLHAAFGHAGSQPQTLRSSGRQASASALVMHLRAPGTHFNTIRYDIKPAAFCSRCRKRFAHSHKLVARYSAPKGATHYKALIEI